MGPDEIEFANLFDLIDNLIDFPPENECDGDVVGSSDGKDLHEALPGCDTFSSGGLVDTASDLSAELAVPYEDIVQLEWLSTFMEESFSDRSPTLDSYLGRTNQFHTSSPVSVLESCSTSSSTSKTGPPLGPNNHCSPQRARSKRPHPPTSTPRHLISSVGPTPHTPFRAHWGFLEPDNVAESPPAKKARKPITDNDHASKRSKIARPEDGPVRKCLHCEMTKTPQWRAGPMGPKTLCNACGVRYKSGRLFPEYRPAASPTFIPALHSNSHRKVVEMRGKAGNHMPEGSEAAEIARG